MGYRSQVRIITTKKGFEELKKFHDNYLKQFEISEFEEYSLLDDLSIKEDSKDSVYFGWNGIKWYGYKGIDAIMYGLKHLQTNDFSYRFSRIGEDYADYDEKYYDSEREEEQGLYFPYFVREFDDEYVIEQMNCYDKELGM